MVGKKSDFNGDGKAEIPVTSPWEIGILKLSDNTLTSPMMAPNGTRFGDWLLNTWRGSTMGCPGQKPWR